MMPLVRRTWAPRGQTPFLHHRTNTYRKVSAIAALVVSPRRDQVQLFFRLHPQGNINAHLDDLAQSTRRHGRSLQRRESMLRSLLKHSPLFLRLK